MILHIDKEQSSQGPSVTGEKNLLSPHLGYLIHSSAHLISERTQQKQKRSLEGQSRRIQREV